MNITYLTGDMAGGLRFSISSIQVVYTIETFTTGPAIIKLHKYEDLLKKQEDPLSSEDVENESTLCVAVATTPGGTEDENPDTTGISVGGNT